MHGVTNDQFHQVTRALTTGLMFAVQATTVHNNNHLMVASVMKTVLNLVIAVQTSIKCVPITKVGGHL